MSTVSEEVEAPNTPLSVSEVCSIKQRNEKDENEKKMKRLQLIVPSCATDFMVSKYIK